MEGAQYCPKRCSRGKVTLRERDSTKQVRIATDKVVSVIAELCNPVCPRGWDNVFEEYAEKKEE